MLPPPSTATCGVNEKSALLETFFGAEKGICALEVAHINDEPRLKRARTWVQRLGRTTAHLLMGDQGPKKRLSRSVRDSEHIESASGQSCGDIRLAVLRGHVEHACLRDQQGAPLIYLV